MADAMEPRSIEDREERIGEVDARLAELDDEFTGTVMPDEARDEWNELNAERDEHTRTVKEMRSRRERLRELSKSPAATERATGETPAFVRKNGTDIYDVTRIRSEARSEEDFRTGLHDNAKRAIEKAHFPAFAGSREKVQEHVEDLLARCDDESGTLAKLILNTGNPTYDRAFGKMLVKGGFSLTSEEQRALAVGTDSTGGFAAPFQLDPTVILTNAGSISPLRQIARVETITGKTWQGITSSGITVSRSAEAAEAADNSFTIGQPEVTPTRVIADVRFSVEVDQDWGGLRSEISRLLMDAKEREEDTAFVTGNGTPPNPGGVIATLPGGSAIDLGTAGTLTLDELLDLEAALPVRHRARGRFLGNKSVYQAIRGLGSGLDGAELWVRLAGSQPAELLGYPTHEASAMAAFGATLNARLLAFGDFSEFLIVDKLGMTVEVNPHIVGAAGRWTGERAVVAVWRNGSLVLNPNAFRVLENPAA